MEGRITHGPANPVHRRFPSRHAEDHGAVRALRGRAEDGLQVIDRYLHEGPVGLEERSRRPRRSPNQTADEIVSAILDARRRHPTWGGKKLLALVRQRHPRWKLPGRSTACDILNRHGMVPIKRRRRHVGHPGKPTSQILAPNGVWSADYKGQFRTGDGHYCYPLTVAEGFSRYLLGCQALPSTAVDGAKPVFTRLFQEYGLPKRIRTDNGAPFATNALTRLSTLSAWWVRLGILPDLIEPGRPAQNGRHERMHRTLKSETTRPAAGSLAAQQRRFNIFREEFTTNGRTRRSTKKRRPRATPPSPRGMPDRLPPLEYPDRFEVRYVSERRHSVEPPLGECVDRLRWRTCRPGRYVYFGPLKLGGLHERRMRIEDEYGRLYRHRDV